MNCINGAIDCATKQPKYYRNQTNHLDYGTVCHNKSIRWFGIVSNWGFVTVFELYTSTIWWIFNDTASSSSCTIQFIRTMTRIRFPIRLHIRLFAFSILSVLPENFQRFFLPRIDSKIDDLTQRMATLIFNQKLDLSQSV